MCFMATRWSIKFGLELFCTLSKLKSFSSVHVQVFAERLGHGSHRDAEAALEFLDFLDENEPRDGDDDSDLLRRYRWQ